MASTARKSKPRDVTVKCPGCNGEGVTQGYYTLGPVACGTCGGARVIPKDEKMSEPADATGDE